MSCESPVERLRRAYHERTGWGRSNPCVAVVFLAAAISLGTSGCDESSTLSRTTGVAEPIFDGRLPDGIAEYSNMCSGGGRTIWQGDAGIDHMAPRAESVDLPATKGGTVYLATSAASLRAAEAPDEPMGSHENLCDFPWTSQECTVRTAVNVASYSLQFETPDALWCESSNGSPTKELALSNPVATYDHLAAICDTAFAADHPSPANELIVDGKSEDTDVNGSGSVNFEYIGVEVIVEFRLKMKNDNKAVATRMVHNVTGADLDLDWSHLAGETQMEPEVTWDDLEERIAKLLARQFEGFSDLLEGPPKPAWLGRTQALWFGRPLRQTRRREQRGETVTEDANARDAGTRSAADCLGAGGFGYDALTVRNTLK